MVSSDSSAQALQNSGRKRKIVVYTTSGCSKCDALKAWLRRANRIFEERSLEDVDVMADLVMRNIVVLSAPVLEVDDAVYEEVRFFNGSSLEDSKLQGILEGNNGA